MVAVATRTRKMDPRLKDVLSTLPAHMVRRMFADAATNLGSRPQPAAHFIPHPPHPGPQTEFVKNTTHKEILYGGSAGGGKTDGLLQAALQYVHVPKYAAVIFRRTSPRLTQADGLIMRSHEWLGGKAKWSEKKLRWTFPSGATLTFAHLQYDKDVFDHGGAAYQFIGWDELTEFTKYQFRFLYSRLRRPDKLASGDPLGNVPLRVRATSNPGNAGHFWVKKRFLDNPKNGRQFIKATLDDNPSLDRESYIESLEELDPVTKRQLLKGDWSATEDGILTWPRIAACQINPNELLWPGGIVPATHVTRRPEIYIGIDVGRTTDNTVIWMWELLGAVKYCREVHVIRNKPFREQFRQISKRIEANGGATRVAIDKGGIGMQLAEELELAWPGVVFGVQLTRGRMGAIAQQMRTNFEQCHVRIPRGSDDLDEDLQLVRQTEVVNGLPIVETERGDSGHADRFWAGGLGLFAIPNVPKTKVTSLPRGVKSKHMSGGKRQRTA